MQTIPLPYCRFHMSVPFPLPAQTERNFLTDFLVTPEFENGTMVH